MSPTMRASHCSVDNSWYCSTYSSGADKPIENNTSLPISDYSLLDQLVQTGLWHLSTETLDVLRSSDARQLSLVGEHGHHPVHQHRSVRVQAARSDRVRHTQYLRHLGPKLITRGIFGSCWTCCGRQFHANATSRRRAVIPTTRNGCKLIDDD